MFTFGIVPTEWICQIPWNVQLLFHQNTNTYVSCGAVFPVLDRNTLSWLYARIVSLSIEYEFRPHPLFVRSTRKENLLAAGTDSPSRLRAASKIASPSNKAEHRASNVLNNRLNIQYCSKYCSHLQQHYEHQRIRLSLATMDRKKGKLINLQALCVLYIEQAFRYSPENAFYIFNQQIDFII